MTSPKDTIQSCATTYSNPYRQDPNAMKALKVMRRERGDTLETEQMRLEKALVAEFLKNKRLPPGTTTLIANIGRGLVMIIALPPFFIFYKAPKWIAEQISPLIMKMAKEGGEKIGTVLLVIFTWPTELYARIQESLKRLLKPKTIKKSPSKKGENLFQLLLKDLRMQRQKMAAPLRWMTKVLKNVQKMVNVTPRTLKEGLLKRHNEALAYVQKGLKFTKSWITTQTQTFKEKTLKGLIKLKNALVKTLKPLDKALNATGVALTQAMQTANNLFVALANPLVYFYKNAVIESTQTAIKAISKPVEMAKNVAVASAHWVKERLQQAVQPLMNLNAWAAATSRNIGAHVSQSLDRFQRGTVDKMRQVARAIKRMFDPLHTYLRKLWDESKKGAKKQLQKWKTRVAQTAKKAVQTALWLIQKTRSFPAYLFKMLRRAYIWTLRQFKKFFWAIRVILTWMKILLRYSFQKM